MIGQFTYPRGGETVTAALDERLRWRCDDPHTLRTLRTMHPATDADWSPSRGGVVGGGLLAEAAATFGVEPYFFSSQLPAVSGKAD